MQMLKQWYLANQKGLQKLMNKLNPVKWIHGMKINMKKTKVMCISRKELTRLKP